MLEQLAIIVTVLRGRLRRFDDRGSVTLEQVVITLALLLAAIAAVAVIVAAITSRTDSIN